MLVKEIVREEEWEKFVLAQKNTLFVQSWKYGDFYRGMGEQAWVFGIYDKDELIGGSLTVSTHAKRGNFLFLPYGPILPENKKEEALRIFVIYLKKFAQEKKEYDFIRVSPFLEDNAINRKLFKDSHFLNAPMHILAETTWLLDISPGEEEIMGNMNKNHRNLIRRCVKEGVKIEKTTDINALKQFSILHNETAQRHKFHKFSDKYITEEFKVFSSGDQALIISARLPDKQLDSSAIIMYYGNIAAYRHGASINYNKKIPTSYLLQWEAIKEAKKRNLKYYNFWGIAPDGSSPKHPFAGITHFKKGFGGKQIDLLRCQDLPLAPKYYINWGVETLRRLKRGF